MVTVFYIPSKSPSRPTLSSRFFRNRCQRDLSPCMGEGIFILDIMLQQQASRIDIQVLCQGVGLHINLQERNQLRRTAVPDFCYHLCHRFQNRVRQLFMQFIFQPLQIPDLGLRVLFQVEDLVWLITPHYLNSGIQSRAFFLLHQQQSIRTAQQPCSTGDRLDRIVCLLFSGMVNSQHTNTMLIGKLLDSANDFIIAGVAVCLSANLSNLLHGIDDNEIGVRVLPHEVFQLFIQSISNPSGSSSKVKVGCILYTVHHKHAALDTLKIIFQCKVEDCSLMDFIAPQILPGTDMVGDLSHHKGLADFGCPCKDICSSKEQPFDNGWSAGIICLEKLCQGNGMQITGIGEPLHSSAHFVKAFLGIFSGIIDFQIRSGYNTVSGFWN